MNPGTAYDGVLVAELARRHAHCSICKAPRGSWCIGGTPQDTHIARIEAIDPPTLRTK